MGGAVRSTQDLIRCADQRLGTAVDVGPVDYAHHAVTPKLTCLVSLS